MNADLKIAAKRLLAMLVSVSLVFAQIPAMAQTGNPPAGQAQLDRILAPIALYPDALLTQVLMASTYPIEVVQAARWSKQNPQLKGEDAVQAVEDREWDPSVKALVAFPQILQRMDEQLEWTTALGDAFLAQEEQVMDTVQRLRQRAQAAGNLSSNDQVRVIERERVIVIEPAQPRVVYVPWYDPWVVYGAWWWPAYPPVRWAYWPGYPVRSGVHAEIVWGIGIGITVGLLFAAIDWPQRHVKVVYVNHPVYRRHAVVHRGQPGPFVWRHDPVHRRGVVYRDHQVRERYARPQPVEKVAPRHPPRGVEPHREQAQPRIDAPRRDARPEPRSPEVRRERTKPDDVAPRRDARPEPRSEPRFESPRDERLETRRDHRSEARRSAPPESRRKSQIETPRTNRPEPRHERGAPRETPHSTARIGEFRSAEPASGAREPREPSRARDVSRGRPEARGETLPTHRARASQSEQRERRETATLPQR